MVVVLVKDLVGEKSKVMMCRTEGCNNISRAPSRTECWSKFMKCRKCCLEQELIPKKGGVYKTAQRKNSTVWRHNHKCEA